MQRIPPGGYYYASNRVEMPEHGGTHIDAPVHFSRGKQTLDEIPIERLVGTGVRIDVTEQCGRDRDYRVAISDFGRWEAVARPHSKRVRCSAGYRFARFWPARKDYLGTELERAGRSTGAAFPWVTSRGGYLAGSMNDGSRQWASTRLRSTMASRPKFESHVALLSHDVPVFENLANLHDLPESGFDVIALPMKIAGGTGGPLRIIAVVPPSP